MFRENWGREKFWFAAACVAAPAFLFAYGIAHFVDGLDGSYGPGAAWTVGHVAFLLGLVTFAVVVVGLATLATCGTWLQKTTANVSAVIGLIGLATFIRIAAIDILTGLRAHSNAAMGAISSNLNSYPHTFLSPYYNTGPILFQLGILALMLQLTIQKPRQIPWWSPVLLLGGFLMLGLDLNFLVPGSLVIAAALVPVTQNFLQQ